MYPPFKLKGDPTGRVFFRASRLREAGELTVGSSVKRPWHRIFACFLFLLVQKKKQKTQTTKTPLRPTSVVKIPFADSLKGGRELQWMGVWVVVSAL